MLLISGLFTVTAPVAWAATTTLYVSTTGSNTTNCTSSATACTTIQDAITEAEGASLSGSPVTIDVAAGTYHESDTIDSTNPTLAIVGAGATTTILDDQGSGSDVTITQGTVSLSGLSITGGSAEDGGGVMNEDTVALDNDIVSNDSATASGAYALGGGLFSGVGEYTTSPDVSLSDDTFANDSALASGTNSYDGHTLANKYGGDAEGGAVAFTGGTVSSTDDTFSNDSATAPAPGAGYMGTFLPGGVAGGGGVFSGTQQTSLSTTFTSSGDTFSNDSAAGVGDSTVTGAAYYGALGGGVDVNGVENATTFVDDTFADDTAEASSNAGYGGGLYVATENSATLTNDTLSGNDGTVPLSSIDVGGGLYNNGTAVLTSDTLSDDSGDGGIVNNGNTTGATVTLADSLLDGDPTCEGSLTDGLFNVENDDTCGLGRYDITDSATIGTLSLATNGSSGPETEAITSSSSAFGEVPLRFCATTTDERGQPRPGVGTTACDAGAFEAQAPTAPQDPVATAGNATIGLTWSAPSSSGDGPVNGYDAYCSTSDPPPTTGYTPSAMAGPSATSVTVSGLANGATYYCVVVSVNSLGSSVPSSVVEATPVSTVPGPPTSTTITSANASLTVGWTDPSSNGGLAITGYDIYCSTTDPPVTSGTPNTSVSGASATSGAVTGLTDGSIYYCVVTALNSNGQSAPSPVESGTPDTTETSLGCAPKAVDVGKKTTCTAKVENVTTPTSTPAGTVTWSGGAGSFSSPTCTLSAGSCSVSYVPSVKGSQTITADFDPNSNQSASTGSFKLKVKK
ncbi:MAG: beta strand repeat-containing protein [Acidimicrobiales bacterium]